MKKLGLLKTICVIFVFCAATAIASPAQVLTTLHSFSGPDGNQPYAGLIQASDGNFYGTTSQGGTSGYGTVLKITPGGALTTLHSFSGADGNQPYAGLIQATDGNFYGTTFYGGVNNQHCASNGCGTVFKISPEGTLTKLYSFCSQQGCTDGYDPYGGLAQATDGNFYGTTEQGGAIGYGTVFQITPSGILTTLHSFTSTDGAYPIAALVQATDGNLYGTTVHGGIHRNCDRGCGTIFKITLSGAMSTLYSFNGVDGALPYAGLVQGTDGNFYGTTYVGGAAGNGIVFRITPSGTLITLCSFQTGCSNGSGPEDAPVQGTDGNFYGTTAFGGWTGFGVVFKITPSGTLSTLLHTFNGSDGANPLAGLVQARDGNLYGTTWRGGAYGFGTVFRLVLPRPCIVCPAAE